ncbi:dimethylsulfonioproprionate lyase family protein [Pelagibius sp. Alg239-R121]|uniref:dimethylsulfonioproprionate lyase family protein n=1 Tax=Pelagibius sp. Alg239-R121 TaxID=2993448 RepID=UPI0024A75CB4|nr:dimethylsulfonioproprionate lyase family protein [Pelagibius sp. Alg239-R121]
MDPDVFLSLLGEAKRLLESADTGELELLHQWPRDPEPALQSPQNLPVLAWLDSILADTPDTAWAFVDNLVAHSNELYWGQTYQTDDFGAAFLQRYGWCKFAGPGSPLADSALACGVLLLGPETEYPSHSHAAEEIYLPLSGQAEFYREDNGWKAKAPLIPVHNPPWIRHAIKTGDTPLLVLYLWSGDGLDRKSTIG